MFPTPLFFYWDQPYRDHSKTCISPSVTDMLKEVSAESQIDSNTSYVVGFTSRSRLGHKVHDVHFRTLLGLSFLIGSHLPNRFLGLLDVILNFERYCVQLTLQRLFHRFILTRFPFHYSDLSGHLPYWSSLRRRGTLTPYYPTRIFLISHFSYQCCDFMSGDKCRTL